MEQRKTIQFFSPDHPDVEKIDDRIGALLEGSRLSRLEQNRLHKLRNDIRYYDGLIARNLLSEDAQSWLPLPDIGYRPLTPPYHRTWSVEVPGTQDPTGEPLAIRWHVIVAGYILRVRDYVECLERRIESDGRKPVSYPHDVSEGRRS